MDAGCYSDGDIIIVPHSFEVLLSQFRAFFSKQHTFGCIYFLLISTFSYVNKRGCFLHCVHCAWMRAIGTYASRVQVLGSFFCLLWNFAGLRAPLSIMRMSHPLCAPPRLHPHYSSLEPTSSSDNSSYHAVKRREALGPSGATRSPPSHFVFKLLCKVPPSGNAAPTAFSCCCPALSLSLSVSPCISSTILFNSL